MLKFTLLNFNKNAKFISKRAIHPVHIKQKPFKLAKLELTH